MDLQFRQTVPFPSLAIPSIGRACGHSWIFVSLRSLIISSADQTLTPSWFAIWTLYSNIPPHLPSLPSHTLSPLFITSFPSFPHTNLHRRRWAFHWRSQSTHTMAAEILRHSFQTAQIRRQNRLFRWNKRPCDSMCPWRKWFHFHLGQCPMAIEVRRRVECSHVGWKKIFLFFIIYIVSVRRIESQSYASMKSEMNMRERREGDD